MTHSDFLAAAMRIVDSEGLDALTFRRLGEEVGVSYTAVYTYFESRQDLVEELAGSLFGEVLASADVSNPSPRERIVSMAMAVRAGMAKHPRALPAFLMSTRLTPEAELASAAVISSLEEAGLTGEKLALAYRTLESYVFGMTVFDLGAAPEHLDVRKKRYAAMQHPAFEALGRSKKAVGEHNDTAFRLGFENLLDGFGV
jgi:TetR/AcrR family transcriptional regulator, tetracycline repressor protein